MCNACKSVSTPTDASVQAAAEHLLGTINSAGLAMMISIGHRTGLFDALVEHGPTTSADLAAAAGRNERYVREWLGAMTTGGIVEYVPGRATYAIPPSYAAMLARESSDSMSSTFQWISVLGDVESDVVDVFSRGGGVPYERFDRFHEVMAEESDGTVVAGLTEHILPLVPGLEARLAGGIDVLDIGCGSGGPLVELAALFPKSRFTGFDLCDEAIRAARARAASRGVTNVDFRVYDVSRIDQPASFDLVTAFDVIHDQRDPAAVLAQVRAALRDDESTFLMQDIRASSHVEKNVDHPLGAFLYTISTMHCMTVSLAQNGAGLGAVWGEELAVQMLGEAGFEHVTVKQLPHDILNNWYVCS